MTILRMMRIAAGADRLRNDPKKKYRKAYSLAELILGAAVIAAFLVRIYQAYAATSASDRFEDYVSEIGLVNGTTHQQFINSGGYGDDGTVLDSAIVDSLPRKYASATVPDITNVYGQSVSVTASAGGAGFTITTSVPSDICTRAAQGDMGRNLISINGQTAPVTADTLTAACPTDTAAGGQTPMTYVFDAASTN